MNEHFTIDDETARGEAVDAIQGLDFLKPHEVIIRPKKKNRTAAQNRLMWLWIEPVAEHTGHTKEEMHQIYKRKFLLPIFCLREDGKFKAMVKEAMGFSEESKQEFIRAAVSTTEAEVEEFTLYLNEIDKHASGEGVRLKYPENLYNEAMGKPQS